MEPLKGFGYLRWNGLWPVTFFGEHSITECGVHHHHDRLSWQKAINPYYCPMVEEKLHHVISVHQPMLLPRAKFNIFLNENIVSPVSECYDLGGRIILYLSGENWEQFRGSFPSQPGGEIRLEMWGETSDKCTSSHHLVDHHQATFTSFPEEDCI